MTKIHTKNLDLTNYGLSCGYINRHENNNKLLRFFKEHSTFYVQFTDYSNTKNSKWLSFDKLTDARKQYKQLLKVIK